MCAHQQRNCVPTAVHRIAKLSRNTLDHVCTYNTLKFT
jgi:hypothetical protein